MKKNMLTVIVIALCLINVVLTAVIVFSVVPAMNQTSALIKQVAAVIDLELESPDAHGGEANVAVADSEPYTIEQEFTINLKAGEDSKQHFAIMSSITLYMNKKHEDYKKLSPTVEANKGFVVETVNDVISQYTYENASSRREEMKTEILNRIHDRFGSGFIYDLSFVNLMFS